MGTWDDSKASLLRKPFRYLHNERTATDFCSLFQAAFIIVGPEYVGMVSPRILTAVFFN